MFCSNFLFLNFTAAPMFFFSVAGAIQIRDDDDDNDDDDDAFMIAGDRKGICH